MKTKPMKKDSPPLAAVHGSADITEADVQTLREILEAWDTISSVERLEEIYANATDHRHDLFGAGEVLLMKLARIASAAPNAHVLAQPRETSTEPNDV